jgi:hypothetical protein
LALAGGAGIWGTGMKAALPGRHVCLDALEAALRGATDGRQHMAAWHEVHRHYVDSFGPAAATIGPPERSGSL